VWRSFREIPKAAVYGAQPAAERDLASFVHSVGDSVR